MLDLQERLSDVLTRLEGHSGKPVEYKSARGAAEEDHQDDAADASSRPCLTAGNSRHHDEVSRLHDDR
jgi:hypothetical protein